MPTPTQELDLNLGVARGATYFAALRDLAQGSKALAKTSTKAVPVVNGLLSLVEAGRLASSPELRQERKKSLENYAQKSPLLSAGFGVINPVGTIYGFGALVKDMLDSNASASAAKKAAHKMFIDKINKPL